MKIRRVLYPTGREKWVLDLGKVEGKRRTEWYDTRKEAEGAMDAAQARSKALGHLGLSLPPEKLAEYAAAERRLVDAGMTLAGAVELAIRHGAAIRERVTLAELVSRCAAHKLATGRRSRSVKVMQAGPLALARVLPPGTLADGVTTDQVQAWLDSSRLAPKTRNNRLSDLRALYAWGRTRGLVAHDPTEGIDRSKVELGPIDYLSPSEVRRLLAATPPGC